MTQTQPHLTGNISTQQRPGLCHPMLSLSLTLKNPRMHFQETEITFTQ